MEQKIIPKSPGEVFKEAEESDEKHIRLINAVRIPITDPLEFLTNYYSNLFEVSSATSISSDMKKFDQDFKKANFYFNLEDEGDDYI